MTNKEETRITQQIATLIEEGSVFVPVEEQRFFEGLRIRSSGVGIDFEKTNTEGTEFILFKEEPVKVVPNDHFGENVCALYDYLESTGVDSEEAYWMMDCAMTLLVKHGVVDPTQSEEEAAA